MEGIDLFVKILVFVKILSQCKKEDKIQILRSARGKLIALKNRCEFISQKRICQMFLKDHISQAPPVSVNLFTEIVRLRQRASIQSDKKTGDVIGYRCSICTKIFLKKSAFAMHVQHHNETWKDSDMLLPNTRYVCGMQKYHKKSFQYSSNQIAKKQPKSYDCLSKFDWLDLSPISLTITLLHNLKVFKKPIKHHLLAIH